MDWSGMVRAAAVLGAVMVLALAAAPVSEARACGFEPITTRLLTDMVGRSPVVVTGKWVESSEASATLRVEKGLKGARPGERIRVDNHRVDTWNCDSYGRPFQEGFRFGADDPREWLLLLNKEDDSGWQITNAGMAAWPVTNDPIEPLALPGHDPSWGLVEFTFDDLRRLAKGATLGTDLAFETRTPCHATDDPNVLFPMSTAVVRANVTGSRGRVWTLEPTEWFGGGSGDTPFTLNTAASLRTTAYNCDLGQYLGSDDPPTPPQQVVVFMRPDAEFGMAEWRPVALGLSVVEVNERYVTRGRITFEDVARVAGQPQLADRGSDGGPVPVAVTLFVAALAAAGVLVLARRR